MDSDAPQDSPPDGPRDAPQDARPPLGQRFYDSPFLLLVLGVLIMALFFTGWGLLEITSLTPAPLP